MRDTTRASTLAPVGGGPVLVVTSATDVHADAVIHVLRAQGVEVVRWHPAELNADADVLVEPGAARVRIHSSGREFSTAALRSCWFRKPEPVQAPPDAPDAAFRRLVEDETAAVVSGIYGRADAVWYSHPFALRPAASKPYQLAVATAVGLDVPAYAISNRADELRAFAKAAGLVVLKPIHQNSAAFTAGGVPHALIVRRFTPGDLGAVFEAARANPFYLQRYIQKVHDVRVTVIARRVFAVAIRSAGGEELVDWRPETLAHEHVVVRCPPAVRRGILRFQRHMRLNFGAFDFSVDGAGRWWFLECNGNGQWLWIEAKTGLPLAETMADHLALRVPPLIGSGTLPRPTPG